MTLYTRGFSHFVTSMTAPTASGRSDSCRVGLAPIEERRLITAHTQPGHSGSLTLAGVVQRDMEKHASQSEAVGIVKAKHHLTARVVRRSNNHRAEIDWS